MRHITPRVLILLLCAFTILLGDSHQVSAASLQVSWIDNSHDEDGFGIERKLVPNGTYVIIAMVGPNVRIYSDNSLANGTTYCYRVYAFNSVGNSAYTNEACGTPSGIPPPPPPPPSTNDPLAVCDASVSDYLTRYPWVGGNSYYGQDAAHVFEHFITIRNEGWAQWHGELCGGSNNPPPSQPPPSSNPDPLAVCNASVTDYLSRYPWVGGNSYYGQSAATVFEHFITIRNEGWATWHGELCQ
jgi:hypothetical protein